MNGLIGNRLSFALPFLFILFLLPDQLHSQIRLFHTTRTTGIVREVDPNTGNILLSNIGGIVRGRGMDISPLGGLYVCTGNDISLVSNTASPASVVLSYSNLVELPHDLCFDTVGNLYVVTNLNVHVYTPLLVNTLSFPHNLTTNTGDGNGNKGWGIEIRPDNGEIFVTGRQGLRRHNPLTGALLGSIPNATPFGFPCLKFTPSGLNNAFLYMGATISGVDQIRVYDNNLIFLRSFFPPHIGNPIDLEIHPVTQDLYLFNTVTSNPSNRFAANEILVPGYSTAANPSQGSAIGDINGTILPSHHLNLGLRQEGKAVLLSWQHSEAIGAFHYVIERQGPAGFVEVGNQFPPKNDQRLTWSDALPLAGTNTYRVVATDQNGAHIATDVAWLENNASPNILVHQSLEGSQYTFDCDLDNAFQMKVEIYTLNGQLLNQTVGSAPLRIDGSAWAEGMLIYRIEVRDAKGILVKSDFGKLIGGLQAR